MVECPQDIERTVVNGKVQVIWKEPEFDDNVEGRHVDRTPTYPNGFKFGKGRYKVTYTAEDKSGNKAICEFKIIVKSRLLTSKNRSKNRRLKNRSFYVADIGFQKLIIQDEALSILPESSNSPQHSLGPK